MTVVPWTLRPPAEPCLRCEKPIRNGFALIDGRGPYHTRCEQRERGKRA